MAPVPTLKGPRVTLRRPAPADVDALLVIGRHAEIVRAYGGTYDAASPLTRAAAERAIARIENGTQSGPSTPVASQRPDD